MVKVYFETEKLNYSELVAVFRDEELYMLALPALEEEAKKHRMIVTESLVFEVSMNTLEDEINKRSK
jgi:hypothetical protein